MPICERCDHDRAMEVTLNSERLNLRAALLRVRGHLLVFMEDEQINDFEDDVIDIDEVLRAPLAGTRNETGP
jgi:hypothetical protein